MRSCGHSPFPRTKMPASAPIHRIEFPRRGNEDHRSRRESRARIRQRRERRSVKVLVTGCAGFIGMHTALHLLGSGASVVGVDNFEPYYDVTLKEARMARLQG